MDGLSDRGSTPLRSTKHVTPNSLSSEFVRSAPLYWRTLKMPGTCFHQEVPGIFFFAEAIATHALGPMSRKSTN